MEKKIVWHLLFLLGTIAFVFLWITQDTLSQFSLQLTALLLLFLIVSRHFLKPNNFKLAESIISTAAVLLVVSSTGSIVSPFFFFNYLLLFELSFLLEPIIPLVLSSAFMLFYLLTTDTNISFFHYAELLAFPLMTPLSYFFGRIYQKEENQKKEIKNLEKKVEELEEELVEEELKKTDS